MKTYFSGKIAENVAYEIGFHKFFNPSDRVDFGINLGIQIKGDHKGVFFMASFLIIHFECNVYDIRHEDDE